ncbi:hypothetical protein KHC28_11310 [Ancylobacter sonchi]|uniref:hypothetical protein n=1 Tax=Ancylobacter sonchi TaxID=1937790 RepID=UPI001BD309E3|nr:hypothetical protein [Ancylobacter sonchi]MBS7534246.1 hypothetical protein [Ancylobacter sonchi]
MSDLTIRVSNLRPAYARQGNTKTIAEFDLEIGEAIRVRRMRLAIATGAGHAVLMPDRVGAGAVTIVDEQVRAAVQRAARELFNEQRPGAAA